MQETMRQRLFIFLFLLVACLSGPGSVQAGYAQDQLSPRLQKIIETSRASHAFWSVTVRDTTGHILEAFNSRKLVRPASNLKLLTSATVLDELGAQFTYKTYMYGVGHQQGHIWHGDIIIRGSGDPSISGRFYHDNRMYVLEEFYSILDSLGIQKITGNLIGNDAYFDEKPYPDGWSWSDLSYYYAVPINALSFNNNTVDLTVYANGNIGETPVIYWFPFNTNYVNFVNKQTITPPNSAYDEYYHRIMGTNIILLKSRLPKGYIEKEALSVANPPLYFLDTFKKYLENGDIQVNGHIMVDSKQRDWSSPYYKVLGMHESHPLKKLLKQMNKESDNFYAEMLLKTAAAEHYGVQGTTKLGNFLMKDFARSLGIDISNISISDGSGLSASTLITTSDLSALLVAMLDHSQFEVYKASLPIAGVDGSLEYRFTGTPLVGRVSAKTGYVSGVRALSGYLQTESNKTLIFSIITNNYTISTSTIDSRHEAIVETLYKMY